MSPQRRKFAGFEDEIGTFCWVLGVSHARAVVEWGLFRSFHYGNRVLENLLNLEGREGFFISITPIRPCLVLEMKNPSLLEPGYLPWSLLLSNLSDRAGYLTDRLLELPWKFPRNLRSLRKTMLVYCSWRNWTGFESSSHIFNIRIESHRFIGI